MHSTDWKQLKSGTDIRGVAVAGIDGEPLNLTDEVIDRIAAGFVRWLCGKTQKPTASLHIAVGHDSRISAQRIRLAVVRSLSAAGVHVMDCGLSSTPAMFMTTLSLACDGAIQITASHHPFHRNGLKFFTRQGGLDGVDIESILQYAQEGQSLSASAPGVVTPVDFMRQYAHDLRALICQGLQTQEADQPLAGYKIIVDAGNGVGGFYATDVLAPLGADTTGSQFLEPDGHFPNHIPNPEDADAMRAITGATLKHHADLGIIFDTDVDRAGCVDSDGAEINRNRLVALASAIALEDHPGGTIVTDSITSSGLKDFIETQLLGQHHRYKRGYRNVINEAIRLGEQGVNAPLAIETSGHAAFRDNYFLDDGAYLITRIIIKMVQLKRQGQSLQSLTTDLRMPLEAAEIRMRITAPNFAEIGESVIHHVLRYVQGDPLWQLAPDNREGIRVAFDAENGDGWFLLRLSVHDPILPLNIESDSAGGARVIARKLYPLLENLPHLDITSLRDYMTA